MADDFHEKLRAHRAHMAAVPLALDAAKTMVVDLHGEPMADDEAPRQGLTAGHVRTLVHEVERLQAREKQLLQDANEAQREFSREAREIAAEARSEGRDEARGGGYY